IGVGPRKIEDELAARVAFAVQGQRPDRSPARIVDHQMPNGPSGTRHGAAGILQGQEKFVAQEGLAVADEGIPTCGLNRGDAGEKARGHAWAVRALTCGSASTRSRYLSASS